MFRVKLLVKYIYTFLLLNENNLRDFKWLHTYVLFYLLKYIYIYQCLIQQTFIHVIKLFL